MNTKGVDSPVTCDVDRDICSIALNRPACLNAVNRELVSELERALRYANSHPDVRAIVLSGNGRAFCSGNDLKDHLERAQNASRADAQTVVGALQDVTRQIVLSDKYVVGAIHGWAVGAGFEWAINCDIAVWAEDAVGFFPELAWGLFPTGGVTCLLPKMAGPLRAREMLLFGERYDARALHGLGVAAKVVAADEVFETATDTARRIAALPQSVASGLKRISALNCARDLEAALQFEANALVDCILDPSTAERIAAFAGKGGRASG